MNINRDFVALVGVIGVFLVLILIVVFMAVGKGVSKDFVSMSEIVTGVGLTIFNVSGGKPKQEEGKGEPDGQLPAE